MKRRTFLKRSLAGAGLCLGFGATGGLWHGCRRTYGFDVVLRNARVLDGTGRPSFAADVGLENQYIKAVGDLRQAAAHRVVDVHGLVVAPGFIDVHTHSEKRLLINPRAESKIRQGVTTEILGLDGDSFTPQTFNAALQKYQASGVAVNVASLVGQGTVRKEVMGMTDRPASAAELRKMQTLVAEALQQGALGVSSGLEYTPGGFASAQEISTLCEVMRGTRGLYVTHMRNEDDRVVEAVQEAIAIAQNAGIGLHISHLKCQGKRNWHKLDQVLSLIADAEAHGLPVTLDRYPYIAYSTGLSNLMPLWSREGGTERFIERLNDPETLPRIRSATLAKIKLLGSWNSVMITSVNLKKNKDLQGKTVSEIVQKSGRDAFDFVRQLLIEENNHVSMVGFAMSEENTARILAHPKCMPASDGSALANYGALSKGNPHPRSYGTFPRVLGRYVREKQVMSLPEAVRKMTWLPATRFGLNSRGRIAEGYFADLVVFDPEQIIDRATFANPHQYPDGIEYVFVNGRMVLHKDEHTGTLPGKALRGDIKPVL